MGANFTSKTTRKLCEIDGMKKTQSTQYHPMGNGMVERFNKTLLNMLEIRQDHQKSDWKSHVPTLTHAYNAAVYDSCCYCTSEQTCFLCSRINHYFSQNCANLCISVLYELEDLTKILLLLWFILNF